jgi:putative ABC transport system permease protein
MTTLLRALLSHYRRHPVQAVFLLTGIVVANVLLVGTLLINAQARASYERGETLLRARPVGEVRPRDGSRPIDEREYLRLRLQGFDMLVPALRQVVQAGNGERLELLGIDLFAMPRSGGRARGEADSGRGQTSSGFAGFAFPPWQLWAAPGRMEQLGWREGERPQLASGTVLPPVVAMPGADLGHRLLLDIGALQALTGSAGQLSSLLVFAAPDDRVAALRAALPAGLELVAGAEAPDPAELTRSFHLNLAAMGLLAFVVGVFLTYNALAFSYTDRRELLRKVQLSGVTPPELARAMLLELAVFLGAGSLLGGWLGGQLAAWLLPGVGRTLAQLYGVYIAYPDGLVLGGLVPGGFLLPLLMTAVAAGLCVLFPLREALAMPLLQRWQAGWQLQAVARRDRLLLAVGGVLLLAATATALAATSLRWALGGMACLLIGAVLCLPMVLRLLLGVLRRCVPPRHARLSWLLADSRWLLGPASLALMALTLALVANSGLNAMIGSFRQATDDWLQQRLAAQLYLRGETELAGAGWAELEHWLAQRDPRLQAVERYRIELSRPAAEGATAQGRHVPVEVVSLQQGERFLDSVRLLRAEPDAAPRFARGEGVYVSERAWRVDGWRPGAALAVCGGRAELPVLGVYHDYGNPRSQWMVSHDLFRQCWPEQGPSGRGIYGPEELDWAELRLALRERFGLSDEQVVDQAEVKATGMAVFERTFTVTRALNALTLLVAGIGIFCAISAIHHHRVGQQAVLASLGVTRRERGALLLLQWGLLGLLCMVLVWPFGAALAAYLTWVVTPVAFGWSFPLRLQWVHHLALAAVTVAALAAAVILPSLRLLRTSPAALLREQAL